VEVKRALSNAKSIAGSIPMCGLIIITTPPKPTIVAIIRRPLIISFNTIAPIRIDQKGEVKAKTIASARIRCSSAKTTQTNAVMPQNDLKKWRRKRLLRTPGNPTLQSHGKSIHNAKNVLAIATTNTGNSVAISLIITNIVVNVVTARSIHRMPRTLLRVGR